MEGQTSLVKLAKVNSLRLTVFLLFVKVKYCDFSLFYMNSTMTESASALLIAGRGMLHEASSTEQVMGSTLNPSVSKVAGSSSKIILTCIVTRETNTS